jgi:hypothetical protein
VVFCVVGITGAPLAPLVLPLLLDDDPLELPAPF